MGGERWGLKRVKGLLCVILKGGHGRGEWEERDEVFKGLKAYSVSY